MNNFILSCCSTADMTKEYFEKRNIPYICFHYELDGVSYEDDLWQSMSIKDFYGAMLAGADAKTSQVNAAEFIEFFEKFLQQGMDVLHVCLSSGISGTYNSANIARDTLQEKYPDRKIYILDSLCASSGYGLLMDKLADLRNEGKSIDELYEWGKNHTMNLHHWFFSTDLTFFVKGGRVSKTSGLIGGLLSICPILTVDREGKLGARHKIRTKKKAIQTVVDLMKQYAMNGTEYSGKCYISHSDCYEDAKAVASLVEENFPNLDGSVKILDIGTTIGSHTGPGTVALFYWGIERQ